MKLKTTKNQVKNNFNTILSLGYCEIDNLTRYKNPFAYSCGVNGWSCDYYNIDGVCLSTGYDPIGKNVDYKLVRKYEAKAQKISLDYNIDYKIKERKVNKLLIEFINKVKN
tara:strand:+ start:134 stop:466 length:333 start_codon:yes stop_codon:yes gene_type:complete